MTVNRFNVAPSYKSPGGAFLVQFVSQFNSPPTVADDLSEPEAKLLAMRLNRTLDDHEMRKLESQVTRADAVAANP